MQRVLTLLGTALLFLGSISQATDPNPETLKIDLALSIEGQNLSSPSITTTIGKLTSLVISGAEHNTFIDVLAERKSTKENSNPWYQLKITIKKIINGEKIVISEPYLLTPLDEQSIVTQYNVKGEETLHMQVKASRKK